MMEYGKPKGSAPREWVGERGPWIGETGSAKNLVLARNKKLNWRRLPSVEVGDGELGEQYPTDKQLASKTKK